MDMASVEDGKSIINPDDEAVLSMNAKKKKKDQQQLQQQQKELISFYQSLLPERNIKPFVALAVVMLLSLVYAFSPSHEYETHVHLSGDSSFDVTKQLAQDHLRFPLRLKLEKGVSYIINETTLHNAYVFVYKRESTTSLGSLFPSMQGSLKNVKNLQTKGSSKATGGKSIEEEHGDDEADEHDHDHDDDEEEGEQHQQKNDEQSGGDENEVEKDIDDDDMDGDRDDGGDDAARRRNRRLLRPRWKARAKSKGDMKRVKHHSFKNHISLKVRLLSDQTGLRAGDSAIKITINDFIGYKMNNDIKKSESGYNADGETVEDLGDERYEKVFEHVRRACNGVSFPAVLKPDGTFREMHTGELRRLILNALHRQGLLPPELEHVIEVGNVVFRANGASFNPNGKTRISSKVIAIDEAGKEIKQVGDIGKISTGCNTPPKSLVQNNILIVKRGDCSFYKKAKMAQKGLVAALIVIDEDSTEEGLSKVTEPNQIESEDTEENDDVIEKKSSAATKGSPVDDIDSDATPQTYMGGSGTLSILSVIVTKKAGDFLLNQVLSLNPPKVTIKGGEIALLALHEYKKNKKVSDIDSEGNSVDDANSLGGSHNDDSSFREGSLGIQQNDGLFDLVGINFIIDEVLSSRFNIFPEQHIAVGDSWKRSRIVASGVSHNDGSEITEDFRVASARRDKLTNNLILRITINHIEKPVVKDENGGENDLDDSGQEEGISSSSKSRPIFVRASANGQSLKIDGWIDVDASNGFVIDGETKGMMEWDRELLMRDFNDKEVVRKGHMKTNAKTIMKGEIIRDSHKG